MATGLSSLLGLRRVVGMKRRDGSVDGVLGGQGGEAAEELKCRAVEALDGPGGEMARWWM